LEAINRLHKFNRITFWFHSDINKHLSKWWGLDFRQWRVRSCEVCNGFHITGFGEIPFDALETIEVNGKIIWRINDL